MSELAARSLPVEPAEQAAHLAGALYQAYRYAEWEGLGELLHPFARFLPLAGDGDDVLGCDDLLALVAGRRGPAFGLGTVELTQLSAEAVLCVAQSPGRQGESRRAHARAAIVTVKDDLLYRERAFASAPDAYRGYLRNGLTLGL
jgi:hypothetical protein